MLMLQRFSPLGTRDPVFTVEAPKRAAPLSKGALVARGVVGGLVALAVGVVSLAALAGLRAVVADKTQPFDFFSHLMTVIAPADLRGWLSLVGLVVFAAFVGLTTAAVFAGRRQADSEVPPEVERRATA
jgi:PAT family beta-lactamase induction signal transducer AmpG